MVEEEEEEEERVEMDRGKGKQPHVRLRKGEWTHEEHDMFLRALAEHGKDWANISKAVRTRSATQTRTHAQKYHLAVEAGKPFPAEPYPQQGSGNQSGEERKKVRY